LQLALNDEGRSKVYDFGISTLVKITLTENKYGTGQSSATIQYRYSDTTFNQDDVSPAWNTYSTTTNVTFRFLQVRGIKQ